MRICATMPSRLRKRPSRRCINSTGGSFAIRTISTSCWRPQGPGSGCAPEVEDAKSLTSYAWEAAIRA